MAAGRASLLALALCAVSVGDLRAQSDGRDLPRGIRSLAGLTVNVDSATTIAATLGRARERRIGTGDDARVVWCYVSSNRSAAAELELMSDASPMGTPGRELNVIRLRAHASAADRQGCARLPASATLSTPAGLRLGLGAAAIQELIGPPTRSTADSMVYDFAAKRYMDPGTPEYEKWNTLEYRESCFDAGPPYANVWGRVIVVLEHGRAVEIRTERYDQSVC